MAGYTVKSAIQTKPNIGQGGEFQDIAMALEDATGNVVNVSWFTKMTTQVPAPGSQIEGTVEPSQYGMKFKKAFSGGGGRQRSPEERKSIVRQHSQQMALMAIPVALQHNVLQPPTSAADFFDLVKRTTDWFEKDAGS